MAKATKKTSRGRSQDRKRVAGGQDCEVRYEAKKTGRSKLCGEEGGQEGRQQSQEGGAAPRPLTATGVSYHVCSDQRARA